MVNNGRTALFLAGILFLCPSLSANRFIPSATSMTSMPSATSAREHRPLHLSQVSEPHKITFHYYRSADTGRWFRCYQKAMLRWHETYGLSEWAYPCFLVRFNDGEPFELRLIRVMPQMRP